MSLAKQAAECLGRDAVLRPGHMAGEPDQVVAESAGPGVCDRARTELLQTIDHQGRRVRPAAIERALTRTCAFGDTLERQPAEPDLGQLGKDGVVDRLLDRGRAASSADRASGGARNCAGAAGHRSNDRTGLEPVSKPSPYCAAPRQRLAALSSSAVRTNTTVVLCLASRRLDHRSLRPRV